MSLQDATAFLERIEQDAALREQVKSTDDAIRVGAGLGLTFTAEELVEAAQGELSPDDLKAVTGGSRNFLLNGGIT